MLPRSLEPAEEEQNRIGEVRTLEATQGCDTYAQPSRDRIQIFLGVTSALDYAVLSFP
jgi:hypothetical protein